MVESAKRHVDILRSLDFEDICLSLKASTMKMCVEAYELASETFPYPLHLGITEAGTAFGGTIRSSAGLGILLKNFDLLDDVPNLVSCPTCGRIQYDLIPVAKEIEQFLQNIRAPITVAIMGCAVNGPGEARNADIGIAGGVKEGLLFKKGEIIRKVKQEELVYVLKKEILEMVKQSHA